MKKNFKEWFSDFTDSISTYQYYTNFDTAYQNVNAIKVQLNIMNSLIGSKTIKDDFDRLFRNYPEIRSCLPLLIAVREKEIKVIDEGKRFIYNFRTINDIALLKRFMDKTGLFDLIANHLVNNLVDYALGVEVGLDSNTRKNRGGHIMEDIVEEYIIKAGFEKDKNYFKELSLKNIEKRWDINLASLSNMGKTNKRFDFVIKSASTIYAIETNFYSGGGSKLNETARSYKALAQQAKDIAGFKFIWITDGQGWKNARNNLEETFDALDTIYNLKELENDILKEVIV